MAEQIFKIQLNDTADEAAFQAELMLMTEGIQDAVILNVIDSQDEVSASVVIEIENGALLVKVWQTQQHNPEYLTRADIKSSARPKGGEEAGRD